MDVGEMQRKLSQWAVEHPEEQYRELYHLLCTEPWLRAAHHHVNTNQGRETAGIDGRTMSQFNGDLEGNLRRLRDTLQANTFEPLPVRRVYIPKANGKQRPIGIATIDDRIVQEALRMALEPLYGKPTLADIPMDSGLTAAPMMPLPTCGRALLAPVGTPING